MKGKNTKKYLHELELRKYVLNKVREIKSREFKGERKWVRREV